MQENNNEKISVSGADLLKDVVADEKVAKTAPKDTEKDKKDKDKKDKKEKKAKNGKKFNAKKLKHGTMATVFTCVFVALLVLVNVVTTMIFDRYPVTIDLTSNKIYSVSNDTEDYVKKVNVDVQVTVFADENTYTNYSSYNKQAVELLKNYSKLNHHITYRFVDIDSHPEIVKEYTDTISQFDIIFETKTKVDGKEISRTRKLGMLDLLTFTDEFEQKLSQSGYSIDTLAQQAGGDLAFLSYYGSYVESSNAEQAFTSALMTVTDPNPVYVTILTGRSELTQLTYFQTLLTANGYNVNTVDITSEDIPSDTDVVVIPAPKTDYLEEDITKVSDFLNNDGKLGKQLLYIASYGQEDTPNLDEFLSEYGLAIGDGVICESDSGKYYNSPCVTVASDVSDNFTQDVSTENPAILSALCRPVKTLFDQQDMVSTDAYLKSSDSAYTANVDISQTTGQVQIGDALVKGQQNYMAVGSKAKFTDDNKTLYSNVVAVGSEGLLSDTYLQYSQYQNSEYFISVINGLTGKTAGITITPKTITGNVFDITQQQKTALKWTFCLGVPVVVLVVGIVIWVRRKNK
ncbi:GldG family protein [uncultured Ruminococcus sp.]|uniref:GldG family protein n=1 Tax=uncultured Ruminococcus sp. TaxID=165186 RepID=UPI0026671139|nr:GldG family protein [uncultured Ruminococcus sp.]